MNNAKNDCAQSDFTRKRPSFSNECKTHTSKLTALLQDIAQERQRNTARGFNSEKNFELVLTSTWPVIFQKAFLDTDDTANGPQDDLIFFVFKKPNTRSKVELKVFRLNSVKLPDFKDSNIDWEETVYLNLLMQYLVYTVTVAVCTRTGPQELQILKKFSETVYASPNRHQMDSKGKTHEVVYPNLVFSLDNYDEIFADCVIRDSECLCVELTAYDLSGKIRGVCFLGTIQYDSLKRFYDSKSTPVQHSDGFGFLNRRFGSMSGRGTLCNMGTVGSTSQPPSVKFMRMLGPQGQGLAEFAVCAVAATPDDHQFVSCRCGSRLGLLGSGCCMCGAVKSPVRRKFDDLTDQINPESYDTTKVLFEIGSPVTRQPTKFEPVVPMAEDPIDYHNQNSATISHIATLHSIPSTAKSAGASAETSPVKRYSYLRHESHRSRPGILNDSTDQGNFPRRGSKVSEILDRFMRLGTTERSASSQPTSLLDANPLIDPTEETQSLKERANIAPRSHSISEENGDLDDNCLFSSRESHRRSFGQAWSWFKERRRLTSIGLNASLTFLSVPSAGILVDILESKREPILNIAD